jgi:uncharacterized cupin superfamily protein
MSTTQASHEDRGLRVERGIAEGEREAIYWNLWKEPNGLADLNVWEAKPGMYPVDGEERGRNWGRYFEVTTIVSGRVTVEEEGKDPIELVAGDTYVMQPGWTGSWIVTETVVKPFVWIHV